VPRALGNQDHQADNLGAPLTDLRGRYDAPETDVTVLLAAGTAATTPGACRDITPAATVRAGASENPTGSQQVASIVPCRSALKRGAVDDKVSVKNDLSDSSDFVSCALCDQCKMCMPKTLRMVRDLGLSAEGHHAHAKLLQLGLHTSVIGKSAALFPGKRCRESQRDEARLGTIDGTRHSKSVLVQDTPTTMACTEVATTGYSRGHQAKQTCRETYSCFT
jgi:hypothetical protein